MGDSRLVGRTLVVRWNILLIWYAVWSAIMDISLALIPWKIIWNLQMRTAEKLGVGVAMSLGVL